MVMMFSNARGLGLLGTQPVLGAADRPAGGALHCRDPGKSAPWSLQVELQRQCAGVPVCLHPSKGTLEALVIFHGS